MLSKKAVFTGTQIAYSVICPTKLWYFTNNIRLEKESEFVAVGKAIHESTFQRSKNDITIDNKS